MRAQPAWRSMASQAKIIYTKTDEAPALATYSLLPVIKRFTDPAGIEVELSDISVAGRVLCQFGHGEDELAALGEMCLKPECNIIKLPNVSASIPQLQECIAELQGKGYDIPDFVQVSHTPKENMHLSRARVGRK